MQPIELPAQYAPVEVVGGLVQQQQAARGTLISGLAGIAQQQACQRTERVDCKGSVKGRGVSLDALRSKELTVLCPACRAP